MKIFVTGGTGVLGRPTVRLLVGRGHRVTALVRNEERAVLAASLGALPIPGDLFDPEFIRRAVGDADVVMHLATAIPKKMRPQASDWVMNDRIRTEGTANLLQAATERRRRAFVLQSVAFMYGDQRGDWVREDDAPRPSRTQQTAYRAEQMALAAYDSHNLPSVILRGGFFYGLEADSTRRTIDAIKKRRFPIIGSGEQYWHYVYVYDMARACVLAAENPAPGEIFFVADDWPFHARNFLNYLAAELNAPAPFKMTVALARVLGGSTVSLLAQSTRFRTDKIKKMLGWTPEYPTYREGFTEILRQLGKRV